MRFDSDDEPKEIRTTRRPLHATSAAWDTENLDRLELESDLRAAQRMQAYYAGAGNALHDLQVVDVDRIAPTAIELEMIKRHSKDLHGRAIAAVTESGPRHRASQALVDNLRNISAELVALLERKKD